MLPPKPRILCSHQAAALWSGGAAASQYNPVDACSGELRPVTVGSGQVTNGAFALCYFRVCGLHRSLRYFLTGRDCSPNHFGANIKVPRTVGATAFVAEERCTNHRHIAETQLLIANLQKADDPGAILQSAPISHDGGFVSRSPIAAEPTNPNSEFRGRSPRHSLPLTTVPHEGRDHVGGLSRVSGAI